MAWLARGGLALLERYIGKEAVEQGASAAAKETGKQLGKDAAQGAGTTAAGNIAQEYGKQVVHNTPDTFAQHAMEAASPIGDPFSFTDTATMAILEPGETLGAIGRGLRDTAGDILHNPLGTIGPRIPIFGHRGRKAVPEGAPPGTLGKPKWTPKTRIDPEAPGHVADLPENIGKAKDAYGDVKDYSEGDYGSILRRHLGGDSSGKPGKPVARPGGGTRPRPGQEPEAPGFRTTLSQNPYGPHGDPAHVQYPSTSSRRPTQTPNPNEGTQDTTGQPGPSGWLPADRRNARASQLRVPHGTPGQSR